MVMAAQTLFRRHGALYKVLGEIEMRQVK